MAKPYQGLAAVAAELLKRSVSAHQAVNEGIATHAEKHAAKRQAADNAKRDKAKLSEPLKVTGGKV